jgi:hypothetical protein
VYGVRVFGWHEQVHHTNRTAVCDTNLAVRGKTASFFEFSLCLSRACLGKMIVFK